ncbi:MAG: hypothetical protein U0R50_00770 [Gaiellales bacterium]
MTFRRLAVLALGILVLAFVAAGCGGDDSSEAADATDTVAVDTANEDTTSSETTSSEDTSSDETTSSDDTTSADEDIDLGDLSGECLEFAGIGAKIAEAMGSTTGANADIGKTAELFDELVDKAPDEIKGDLEVLSEGIATMAEALKGVDLSSGATPDADQLAKLQEVMASLDSEKLQAAANNIEAWTKENCRK